MKKVNDISKVIRSKGMRITAQKNEVIKYLHNNKSHPTIEDIYSHTNMKFKNISKKTIYSIVESLKAAELVNVVEIGEGVFRVDPNMDEHDHFICNICNTIYDCEKTTLAKTPNIIDLGDVEVNKVEILYHGTCTNCTKK